jgi:VanZ family protein
MTSVHRTRRDVVLDVGFWALTAACVAATLWFSFVAPPPGADLFTGADKVVHAIAFFTTTLSFLLSAVWRPGRGKGRFPEGWRWFLPAAAAGGVVIEIVQDMIPTRTAEAYDMLAGAIGVAAAVAVHALIRWRMAPRVAQLDPRL